MGGPCPLIPPQYYPQDIHLCRPVKAHFEGREIRCRLRNLTDPDVVFNKVLQMVVANVGRKRTLKRRSG